MPRGVGGGSRRCGTSAPAARRFSASVSSVISLDDDLDGSRDRSKDRGRTSGRGARHRSGRIEPRCSCSGFDRPSEDESRGQALVGLAPRRSRRGRWVRYTLVLVGEAVCQGHLTGDAVVTGFLDDLPGGRRWCSPRPLGCWLSLGGTSHVVRRASWSPTHLPEKPRQDQLPGSRAHEHLGDDFGVRKSGIDELTRQRRPRRPAATEVFGHCACLFAGRRSG